MWLFFSLNKMGKIAAGVAHAELKYLSFMVALIPGLASSWIASRTANSLPRMYAVLLLSSLSAPELKLVPGVTTFITSRFTSPFA